MRGQTITLYFDTKLPRPYDLIYRVQGTKGICMATTDKIYVEGRSPKPDTWESMEAYYKEFEHPLWKAFGRESAGRGGHGGGDWLEMHRLIKALQTRHAAGHGRLRRGRLELHHRAERKVGRHEEQPDGLPRLHPRSLEDRSADRHHRRGMSPEVAEKRITKAPI